jgi:Coenzyme PQQ synthesis protein D (PqqD)
MSEINFRMNGECQTRAEEIAACTAEPGEQCFTRAQSVVSRVAGGETLVVPVRGKGGSLGSIYSFKGTGSFIWQMLDVPRALPELIDAMEREFGAGQEQAQRDVTQFLADMLSVGLVQTSQRVAAAAFEMTATESQRMLEAAGSR